MKRVRYAIGAAALAPAAMGTLPVAAHAATVSGAAKAKTKSVVLDHTGVTPDLTSCVASVPFAASSTGSLITKFTGYEEILVAKDVCVGTLYANRHFLNKNCVNMTFHVKYKGGTSTYTNRICGNKNSTISTQHTFRKEFPAFADGGANYVEVSVTSTYSNQIGVLISSHGALIGGRIT
jgi:hypothetical protein